jgi:hypothetical protein
MVFDIGFMAGNKVNKVHTISDATTTHINN